MAITYLPAQRGDEVLILQFIKELAAYEKLSHQVTASEGMIAATLFGDNPKAFCYIAREGGVPVGFALCFYNYSTFQGRPGIYIEDLYIRPEHRGKGIGKGFFRVIAQRAMEEDCGRIQWWVLNWNEPSIEFYKKLGAVGMDEWTVMRVEGDNIEKLAA